MTSDRDWVIVTALVWGIVVAALMLGIGIFVGKNANAAEPRRAEPLEAIPLEDEDDDGDLDPETRLLRYPDSWKDPR